MNATTLANPEILELATRGDRKKKPTLHKYRRMTRDEVLALGYNDHPLTILNDGTVGTVKINGAIKRWIRQPERAEIPVKYGMYEFDRLDIETALRRFVVEVE